VRKKRGEVEDENGLTQHTIWDIAQQSGVSIATVSRVINEKPYVSEVTRAKVQDVMSSLGYIAKNTVPNQDSKQLQLIGLTSTSMHSGEYAEILAGITEALHARHARPVICPIPNRHNSGLPLLDRVMFGTTEGALILGSTDEDAELVTAYEGGFPLVVIHPNRSVDPRLPVVAASRWSAVRTATEYLLTLGHQRIYLLAARFSQYSSRFRYDNSDSYASFQAAMRAGNNVESEHFIFEVERNTKDDSYQLAQTLLAHPEPPTAILALSDPLAIGALHAASTLHLAVPEQLSLIGFDDLEAASMTLPELTTVQQPFQEMGRIGVDMLFRLINGQKLDVTRTELSTRLMIRGSTAPPQR
jgi:LacI family transcriptional regulator